MTTTLEGLRAKESKLREEEKELAEQFRTVAQDANLARRRDEIRKQMEEAADERKRLWPEIASAKEERKRQGVAALLHSSEYSAALTAALEGLAVTLGPWQALYAATKEAQRVGFAAPALPATIGILFAEGSDWLTRLVRRGVLTRRDVPAPLKGLLLEVPK